MIFLLTQTNQAFVRGTLEALPEYSHAIGGKEFYRFTLSVPRLSGAVDRLPVIASEAVLNRMDLSGGDMLTVSGSVRSHNRMEEDRRRLLIFLFADSILAEDGPPINEITLRGNLCREPTYRRTPLGREICDIMLAVPRPSRRGDYIPCILWGSTARMAAQCHTRDGLFIQGRLQSRVYTKLTEGSARECTAYEVSALSAEME